MDEVMRLGPMNIKLVWVIVGGGLLAGYFLLSSIFKGDSWKKLRETISNSLFIFIITYFFGTIIFRFPTFVSDPLSVISYPSGQNELFLATVISLIYLIYSSQVQNTGLNVYIYALMHILLPVTIIFAFFQQKAGLEVEMMANVLPWEKHAISLYTIILAGLLLFYLFYRKRLEVSLPLYLLWVGGLSGIQILNISTEFFGIAVSQVYYLFLFAIGIVAWLIFKSNLKVGG